jgi:50S ribosomal protein L16 3-hydroxylase
MDAPQFECGLDPNEAILNEILCSLESVDIIDPMRKGSTFVTTTPKLPLLGGNSPAQFLMQYWQKTPLLVRNAKPDFAGLIDLQEMFALACSDEVRSRLIMREGDKWHLEHGPFSLHRMRRLRHTGWTLLVQDLEQRLPAARALLNQFNFVPYARLDDLMVSYAPPGGGVGPHFDYYDVFLLQGQGRRRWQVGDQRNLELRTDLPLKILRRFAPQGSAVLNSGDMLYLPPRWAHNGTAIDHCFTYSIGFRAADNAVLCHAFIEWLEDQISVDGRYADPGLRATKHPALLPEEMIAHAVQVLEQLRWTKNSVYDFFGAWLSEPKALAVFTKPISPMREEQFARQAALHGVSLALQSSLLYTAAACYMNGERTTYAAGSRKALYALANQRRLPGIVIRNCAGALPTLYAWYQSGYLVVGETDSGI